MARNRKNPPAAVAEAPPLDFAALASQVQDDQMAGSAAKNAYNPFTEILRQSYLQDDAGENGVKSNTVPGFQVRALVRQLRHAAAQLAKEEIGLRLRYRFVADNDKTVEIGDLSKVPEDNRPVVVKFLGRPRKIYLTDEEKTEALERGFVIGESDPPKIDAARYLAWRQAAQQDEESDNGDVFEENGDDE